MKIINWQCHFTAHQVDTWNALQLLVDEPILHVIARLEEHTRMEQGWKSIDTSGMNVIMFDGWGWLRKGINIINQNLDAVHVFGGFWADRRFFPLIVYAVWKGARVAVMNEAYSTSSTGYLNENLRISGWIKVRLRPLVYAGVSRFLNFVGGKNRICLLAISHQAVCQFLRAGFNGNSVFPFGYFVQKAEKAGDSTLIHEGFRIIYVGSLLQTKGVDFAARSIYGLLEESEIDLRFDIYGSGNVDLIKQYLSPKIAYKGSIPFGKAQHVIANYDVLLLPSRHDGWGVVVNEALLQGIPVIVSDKVGAKCLVEANGAGAVFESENADSLQGILRYVFNNPDILESWRIRAEKTSHEIAPEKAAAYMLDVFSFFFQRKGSVSRQIWSEQEY